MQLARPFADVPDTGRRGALQLAGTLVAVGWHWWDAAVRAAPAGGHAVAVAGISLAVRVAAWLVEAGWYVLVWRAAGRRLPVVHCLHRVVPLSLLSLWAQTLAEVAHGHATWAPGLAVVAGPAALHVTSWPWLAFGDAGLLTAARLVLTGEVHARALDRGRGAPILLCALTWLATRIAIVLATDLVRGRSPW